jgi:hypothetical protein
MREGTKAATVLVLVALGASSASCAGSTGHVKADSLEQPVSFTPCVFDSGGAVYTASPRDIRKHVKLARTHWTMFWTLLNLTSDTWDLSEPLAAELSAAGGNAVVNLTVEAEGNFWGYFAALVPVLPSWTRVRVECDIVHVPDSGGTP